jgi:hypothetical protein
MKCPICGSTAVFRSRRWNQRLPWLLRGLIVMARCHRCERRFLVRGTLAMGRYVATSPVRPHEQAA